MRRTIFISHANPEDNQFASWLYFKLIGMGYDVWCEIKTLKAGEYFWDKIENLIRNDTIKFLFVSSISSASKRGGVSDEFDFARSIAIDFQLERFIYILKIDDSPSNSRIGQQRINHVDFSASWAIGLSNLLKELREENVPTIGTNFDSVNDQWKNLIQEDSMLVNEKEVYSSNKFPIEKLPQILYCHAFDKYLEKGAKHWEFSYPVRMFNGYVLTFAKCHDFESDFPRTIVYDSSLSIEIPTSEILDGSYDSTFISNQDAQITIKYLLNDGLNRLFKNSGLWRYKMSSKKLAFWYPINSLEKNKAGGILMVGKLKGINWHFALSGAISMKAPMHYSLSSHIVFTEDGKKLLPTDTAQHKARRKQGRQWWNKHWREKLFGFLSPLIDEEGYISINLGNYIYCKVSGESILFESPVSYIDPNIEEENILEGDESFDLNNHDDDTDEDFD